MLNTHPQTDAMHSAVTLNIDGMTCNHCVATIQTRVKQLAGVKSAQVSLRKRTARITFNPEKTSVAALKAAIIDAGYFITGEDTPTPVTPSTTQSLFRYWQFRVVFFGLLGTFGLMALYLGLVSWAEGWSHAVELMLEDAWIVGPILLGFGVQVGLYTYLKTVVHAAGHGTGAMAGAGGGTSTIAMVACCAHHVTDVLPLLGLSAAATFLADYRIPFMVVGLVTNLIGIGVMIYVIFKERNRMRQLMVAVPAEMNTH